MDATAEWTSRESGHEIKRSAPHLNVLHALTPRAVDELIFAQVLIGRLLCQQRDASFVHGFHICKQLASPHGHRVHSFVNLVPEGLDVRAQFRDLSAFLVMFRGCRGNSSIADSD